MKLWNVWPLVACQLIPADHYACIAQVSYAIVVSRSLVLILGTLFLPAASASALSCRPSSSVSCAGKNTSLLSYSSGYPCLKGTALFCTVIGSATYGCYFADPRACQTRATHQLSTVPAASLLTAR